MPQRAACGIYEHVSVAQALECEVHATYRLNDGRDSNLEATLLERVPLASCFHDCCNSANQSSCVPPETDMRAAGVELATELAVDDGLASDGSTE
jgi:hypothetical protein